MNNRSITGKGIRRRLRGLFTRQSEEESTAPSRQNSGEKPNDKSLAKPRAEETQTQFTRSTMDRETPQKPEQPEPNLAKGPDTAPLMRARPNGDASVDLSDSTAPTEATGSTQATGSIAASSGGAKSLSRDTTQSETKAHPPKKRKPMSFAERIKQGKATPQPQTALDSPSFTSGPAAHLRAEQLAAEATVQTNEEGLEYWGPIDNDSARAKAAGQTLVIDQEECISCGTCVENTEHVFYLPDDAKAVTIEQEGPMELIQDAIDACPVTCIHWTESPQDYRQLNDRHGQPI